MPLPSQSSRGGGPGIGRASVYRKRRRRGGIPPAVRLGGGIAAVVVVGWLLWSLIGGGGGPAAATAQDEAGNTETGPADNEVARLAGADPVVIDQGSPFDTSRGTTRGTGRDQAPARRDIEPTRGGGLLGEALVTEAPTGAPESRPQNPVPDRAPARSAGEVSAIVRTAFSNANQQRAANDPLGARVTLNDALHRVGRDGADAAALRAELMALNEDLVFGPRVVPGDEIAEMYVVRPGDALSRISSREGLGTHWKLIQRVNRLSSPNNIRVGQSLKLVRGPFHVIVDKSDYRADVYHGPAEAPEGWTFITSLPVGLGEDDSTPAGRFIVRPASKLENPSWVNPRNPSERYSGDDPENPIGEHWVGIDGLGDDAVHTGLGLHGTIEPESIGTQASMGCVRLGEEDVAVIYELLTESESLVTIVE
jgi:lipoprotein-anchoring transpeptidase ErfK/SrfK